MLVRQATEADISAMIILADAKRTEYATYAPTFWRKAQDGIAKQTAFFQTLLTNPTIIALVHETAQQITGFVIASIIDAPPVYDPGTKICMIDDFTVADSSQWVLVGSALLNHARAEATQRGATLTVVVCGHRDAAKRELLEHHGFGLASEWYVNPL